MENLETLSQFVGDEKAKEILKLTKAYDNYVSKFKKKIDNLLSEVNYEVKTGVVFNQKSKKD